MLATSTRKKLEARSSGNKENAPGNSSNSNAAQTSSEVAVILALRNKIAQQAQELTTLNGEFVQCKDEKLAAERRICELLARSVVSSLPTPSQATAVTTKRRFDKEVSLKLDALEKTLNLSEQKCEELARQKRETEQRLEDKVRECGAQSRRVSELTSEMDVLKSHLEYSQRSGNPVSRANKSAAAIARSAAHVSLEENRKLRLALDQARRSSEAAKHATTERERQLQQHIAGLQEALMNKSCAAADEAHERSKNKHDVRKSKHKYEDEDENEGHKAIEELAATRGQMAAMREALEEYRCAMQTSDREKSALRAANDGLEAKLQEQREALSTVRLDNDRLHIGEAGAKLRVLEKERDVLVDYVQSETTKHAALQARAEAAESALRSSQYAEQAVMEKLKHSLTVLEAERQRREGVENRLLGMVELQATLEEARSDKLALTALCDRKSLEIEEISRMHEVLLGQLRTKEAATRELEEEARQRAGQQADLAHAKAELAALRVRMQSTDAECQAAVNKVAALEPETLQLRRELASLRPAHASQAAELERLRPAERLLSELHSDLTSLSHSASAPVDYLSRLPLSHAHSAWAAVPALRHVSAPLYDRVKAVLNDLYRKEMEAEDLKGVVAGLQRELEVARKDLGGLRRHAEERAGRAVQTLQEAQLQADEAKARAAQAERLLQTRLARVEAETKVRVDAAEAESAALRSARAALDQVRTGVRTFGVATGKHKRAIGTVQMEKEERLSDEQVAEAVCAALMSHSTTLSTLKDARANLEKEKSAGAALSAELAKANEDLMQVRGSLSALRASDKAAKAELHDANLLAEKHSAHAASLEAKVRIHALTLLLPLPSLFLLSPPPPPPPSPFFTNASPPLPTYTRIRSRP